MQDHSSRKIGMMLEFRECQKKCRLILAADVLDLRGF